MTRVFISYSNFDKEIARRIAYDLEFNGVHVWFDEFEIKLGHNIQKMINEGLQKSDIFLVLMSKESSNSPWVNYEIESYASQGKEIIIILLNDLVETEALSYFGVSNIIDFRESYSKGLRNLLNNIYLESNQNKLSEQKNDEFNNYIDISQNYIEDIVFNYETKPIPEFQSNGYLPKGIHVTIVNDFINRFTKDKERLKYKQALVNIINFGKTKHAKFIIFGGSFITSKSIPSDIDCVIVFEHSSDIPGDFGKFVVDNTPIDTYYASLDDQSVLKTLVNLFSQNQYGNEVGIIKVGLTDTSLEEFQGNFNYLPKSSVQYEKSTYIFQPKGILITVHGLLSKAEWNTKIAPIASSSGWIFAPYVYKTNWVDLLFRKNKRKNVVNDFRDWIFDLQMAYKGIPISVIAHSFGTYIIAEYLEGFGKEIPVRFQSIILTGSIINRDFDWYKHYKNSKVVRVRNEVAINDNWVKKMPEGFLRLDNMFGKSGVKGFNKKCGILEEKENNIFDHNNVIRRDVVEKIWMPYLNANSNIDFLD